MPSFSIADLAVGPAAAPVQLARKGRRRRKGRKSGGAVPAPAAARAEDDRTLSFRDLPPGPVRAYRMEAATQQHDKTGRPKWAHVHVGPRPHLYVPKPTESYSTAGDRYQPGGPVRPYRSRTRGIAKDDERYAAEFLKNRRDTGRNAMFVNFGEPRRALELYRQKKANEPHLDFRIRSMLVPGATFSELRKQSVHEADAQHYPTRPFNVDRKAPNQLGLRERHIDLLNSTALPGTAREEDIDALERKYGPGLDGADRQVADRQAAPKRRRRGKKRGLPALGRGNRDPRPDLDEPDDEEAPDPPRPRGLRLGDFFSAADQRRFGYDRDG